MALEAELRSRVERSLRELEEISGALQEVKRLAESERASAEQLARASAAIESTGGQFRALLEGVGQSGAVLQSAVEAVRAADPGAMLHRVDAVGASLAAVKEDVTVVRQHVGAVGGRVDAAVQLGESARGELGVIRTTVGELPGKLDAAARAQAAALERMEKAVSAQLEATGRRIEALEKRVGTAVMAAWVAAVLAAGGTIAGVIGLLR